MDKNAIKKYAVWARKELIARVTQKAEQYGITEKEIIPKDADSIGGRLLTDAEKNQRKVLIEKVETDGFEQVMEEVAYTWFNRFTALRFMEVNNYLPSHTRVFTNEKGEFKPQILADAIHLELDGLDMDKVYELKDANKTEELYKYLLIIQCNALSGILPRMFQKIAHYTELLLPDHLDREGGVIERMIAWISEEDWTDQVQIIGWLYQYYNSEPKDAVFAALKKNIKISKENIPAATQLFTPDWIVRYMVENSLGRLWLEGHPDVKEQMLPTKEEQAAYAAGQRDPEDRKWHYYLEEATQEPEVEEKLAEIRKEYAALKPEDIRCIDPCMGSGHILCYMFDILVKIYEDYGYTVREAVENIIEKNLWGLDIDERAAQLSYFAVMMKARKYDRRFFNKKDENGELRILQPHVYAIEESNGLRYGGDYGDFLLDREQQKILDYLFDVFEDAKEYGSILEIEQRDYDGFLNAWGLTSEQTLSDVRMIGWYMFAGEKVVALANQAKTLSQKYHVVVTNPPYMGSNSMSTKLTKLVKKNYPNSKSDLFAVFIEKCAWMIIHNGFCAMITQQGWMFVNSLEKLRSKILLHDFINMAHLGSRAFEEISGEVVQTTAFVQRKNRIRDYKASYVRLISATTQSKKESQFLSGKDFYRTSQSNFQKVPGHPIAYWVSDNFISAFSKYEKLGSCVECAAGISTGDNEKYLKLWFEVVQNKIAKDITSDEGFRKSAYTYVYCNKGGGARKWYGNNEYVVIWSKSEKFHRNGATYKQLFFIPGITWSEICMGNFAARYYLSGQVFDHKSPGMFASTDENQKIYLGLLNSIVVANILSVINPTISTGADTLRKVPVANCDKYRMKILEYVDECICFSKEDWDSFETSWDFSKHPLVAYRSGGGYGNVPMDKWQYKIVDAYHTWESNAKMQFECIKSNEEELNRIFIDIYGLQDELTPEVEDKDITVRKADLQRDIKSLISYAVGCMFGRYSLDMPGLVYAGGTWDTSKYTTFQPDKDAIIPICDDEYFDNDIVSRFVKFIEVVYGRETLEENLKFIADALGGKGSPREVIRNYFLNGFYADHCKIYQKRPIYWLFDPGKKNGFKCLIYMHRYQPDTIARIRTDYVHEQQSRYRTAITDLEKRMEDASTSERVKLNKQLSRLRAQAEELRIYEEKIHHLADQMISIDLDDGVKVNYAKFQEVLAKIK